MMLNALTILASGSARWTRSPSESSPLIESFGGKPPEKSSGFIASITTLPAKLSRPASAITSSAASPRTAKTSSSLPAAASAKVPAWIPAPSVDSHSRSSGFSGSRDPMVTSWPRPRNPEARRRPTSPVPNTPTRVSANPSAIAAPLASGASNLPARLAPADLNLICVALPFSQLGEVMPHLRSSHSPRAAQFE